MARHSLPAGFILLTAAALAGCVAVPIPTGGVPAPGSRGKISTRTLERLQPGITTRREILFALGQPDYAVLEDGRFAYLHRQRDVGLAGLVLKPVWVLPIPFPLWTGLDTWELLLLEFDERGTLLRMEVKTFGVCSFPDPVEETRMWGAGPGE